MSSNGAHLAQWKWPKGFAPNPAGRPKGSRNRLEERFLADLADDWQEHGKQCVIDARAKDPLGYMKAVATLMPKKVENLADERLTKDELELAIAAIRSLIDVSETPSGVEDSQERGTVTFLPAVPEAG